jgi:hypothetical protein
VSAGLVLAIASIATFLLGSALVVAFGQIESPGPSETAVAYEHAWDRLDFATIWNLSNPLLRDGRSRDQFVADKRAAYRGSEALTGLVRSVRPTLVDTSGPVARVLTQLELADGVVVVDEMLLERDGSAWRVTAYSIVSKDPATRTSG